MYQQSMYYWTSFAWRACERIWFACAFKKCNSERYKYVYMCFSRIHSEKKVTRRSSILTHRSWPVLQYAISCNCMLSLFMNAKTHYGEKSYELSTDHDARHLKVFQYAISCNCMQSLFMNAKTHDVNHTWQLTRLESVWTHMIRL